MSGLIDTQTAVVTGAASGTGRAIATKFAKHGADVVVADVRESPREGGTPTHDRINSETGSAATFVECDVSDPDSFEPVMAAADEFGGLDIMVNNAGIVGEQTSFTDTGVDTLRTVFDINVEGVFNGARAAAIRMLETGTEGSIINMSSIAGIRAGAGNGIYAASKGAVRLFTYALAAELGSEGIRVNAIHPGVIETSMTNEDVEFIESEEGKQLLQRISLERFGQPEDVANIAVFLGCDLAGYVTGESVVVDGGFVNRI